MEKQKLSKEAIQIVADEIKKVFSSMVLIPLELLNRTMEQIHQKEVLDPMLDPTAYMRGGHKILYYKKSCLEALIIFKKTLDKIDKENKKWN